MDSFETAFQHILIVETSKFTDLPTDRGGPTRYGITMRTLSAYLGRTATVEDIKSLSISTARGLYRRLFWDDLNLDLLPSGIAICVFDQAVNRGGYQATLSLQVALGVIPDGRLGPITVNAAKMGIERQVILEFCELSMRAYITVVKRFPEQIINLSGWSARIFRLISLFCLP